MQLITIPERLDAESALVLSQQLLSNDERSDIEIDFGRSGYASPFAMLVLTSAFQKRLLGVRHRVTGAAHCEYLAHMGFFRFCGLEHDSMVAEPVQSLSHLPITRIDLDVLRADAKQAFVLPQVRIEKLAHTLARQLLQSTTLASYRVVQFNLQELLRNVLEHSGARSLVLCAQYWPMIDQAEIGVLDTGIGVARSLGANRDLHIENDSHALALALLPGISATRIQPTSQRSTEVWANAGFGLYMMSQIAQLGGNFIIASGMTALRLREYQKSVYECGNIGTALCVRFSTRENAVSPTRVSAIARAGERIAQQLTGVEVSAPVASKMLGTAPVD